MLYNDLKGTNAAGAYVPVALRLVKTYGKETVYAIYGELYKSRR